MTAPTPSAAPPAEVLRSWHEECRSAWLYRRIAAHEADPAVARMFASLADAADAQAALWARQAPAPLPVFTPDLRARLAGWGIRWLGPRALKPALAALKVRGLSALRAQPLPAGHAMPTALADVGARHRGVAAGGNLRAAVFGVNDGLVSNTCLILGVAGAGAPNGTILTTGIAGLLAGALSMAAGEYLSMRSQRELFESQIALERAELASYPEEEIEELALIYHARGLSLETARDFARALIAHPEHALDTLAREELGLNPDDLGSPWGAAAASFVAFAVGAVLPLLPYLGPGRWHPLGVTTGIALAGLFSVGATLSLFTGRSAIASGLRMTAIGAGAGAATWLLGHLFGVAGLGV
ncbi:MAG: VIT1/CCC1 transporter family protein [Gammaproteobacteria bacterium]